METAARYGLLRLPIRLVSFPLLFLLPLRRLLSLVTLQEIFLSLSFLACGLRPCTLDLDHGTSFHVWAPARRRPGRPPLVLVHGFGGNSKWQLHRQVRRLSRSFDLYVPDLVFFGASRSGGGERSVAFQARCVGAAMRRLGVGRYAVAGLSYGGFVAYRMAAELGVGVVERVVVMTAGVSATAEQLGEMAEREDRDVSEILLPQRPEDLMALIRRSMYRPPIWLPRFLLRDFIEVMYKNHRKERLELLKELLSGIADAKPLPVLTQETLIIWGDQDKVFPIRLAYRLQKEQENTIAADNVCGGNEKANSDPSQHREPWLVQCYARGRDISGGVALMDKAWDLVVYSIQDLRHLGPKARLEVIKDAGHAVQLEKYDRVNHLIEKFLLDTNESKST